MLFELSFVNSYSRLVVLLQPMCNPLRAANDKIDVGISFLVRGSTIGICGRGSLTSELHVPA
jgi:hypothetical protein